MDPDSPMTNVHVSFTRMNSLRKPSDSKCFRGNEQRMWNVELLLSTMTWMYISIIMSRRRILAVAADRLMQTS